MKIIHIRFIYTPAERRPKKEREVLKAIKQLGGKDIKQETEEISLVHSHEIRFSIEDEASEVATAAMRQFVTQESEGGWGNYKSFSIVVFGPYSPEEDPDAPARLPPKVALALEATARYESLGGSEEELKSWMDSLTNGDIPKHQGSNPKNAVIDYQRAERFLQTLTDEQISTMALGVYDYSEGESWKRALPLFEHSEEGVYAAWVLHAMFWEVWGS